MSIPDERPPSRRAIVLLFIGLVLAMLLAALSQNVLSAAIPTIVGDLAGIDQMLWVMTAYFLASTIMMPIYGKISDLFGRKIPLISAIGLFMLGSVIGALATDMEMLIVGRFIQGLGGGGVIVLAQAIVADVIPARERGKYMGILGAVYAVSSVTGPLLGGWMTNVLGWRSTFWMNVPLGLIALVAVVALLRLRTGPGTKPRIDVGGMAILAALTTSIVLVASWGGTRFSWSSPAILGLVAVAVALVVTLVVVERRAAEPILPPALFWDRNCLLVVLAMLILGVTMSSTMGYLPTYLQMSVGADAAIAGMLMVPLMASVLVASIASGWLVSRHGRYKWLAITGAALVAGALVLLGTLTPYTPLPLFCAYVAALGAGIGINTQILVLIVQNSSPARLVGTATATTNFFRQIGSSLGAAAVGSAFAASLGATLVNQIPRAAMPQVGDVSALTPEKVRALPPSLASAVAEAYADALAPLFWWLVPLAVTAAVLLRFVTEIPLRMTLDDDTPDAIGGTP